MLRLFRPISFLQSRPDEPNRQFRGEAAATEVVGALSANLPRNDHLNKPASESEGEETELAASVEIDYIL